MSVNVQLHTVQFAAALAGRRIPNKLRRSYSVDSRRPDFASFGISLPKWRDFTIGDHLTADRGGHQVVITVQSLEPMAYDVRREIDRLHIRIWNAGANVHFPDDMEQAECAARGLSRLSEIDVTGDQILAAIFKSEPLAEEELPPAGCRITAVNDEGLHRVSLVTKDAAYHWPLLIVERMPGSALQPKKRPAMPAALSGAAQTTAPAAPEARAAEKSQPQ